MNNIVIRDYMPSDKDSAMQCFRSNVPEFFSASDESWFESALDEPDGPSFVMVHEESVIGFGGYEVSTTYNSAVLVFGQIHAHWHGKGLGKQLLEYRINHLKANAQPTRYLVVDTILKVAPFFVKHAVGAWRLAARQSSAQCDHTQAKVFLRT